MRSSFSMAAIASTMKGFYSTAGGRSPSHNDNVSAETSSGRALNPEELELPSIEEATAKDMSMDAMFSNMIRKAAPHEEMANSGTTK